MIIPTVSARAASVLPASASTAAVPPPVVFIGIDWADAQHLVQINELGGRTSGDMLT